MIEKNINEALVENEPSAKALISMLDIIDAQLNLGEVSLYHEFPLYLDETGERSIKTDILFLSRMYGIVIFECHEVSDRADLNAESIAESLNQIDRLVFAKILKDAPKLQKNRRSLKVEIIPVIYLNNCEQKPTFAQWSEYEVISSQNELERLILSNKQEEELSVEEYKDLKATIEGSKGIIKPTFRSLKNNTGLTNSRGAILTSIDNDIYNFDVEQKRAALFTIDGAQRIRGLAGSGKTIILTMKAALIHLQNPSAEILYTYYTKALYDLIRSLITRFYRQFAEQDPNWNKIHIMHAWGGTRLEGVYYNACHYNNITPIKFDEAKSKRRDDPFGFICEQLNRNSLKKQFDYAILDEAQDFPMHFYRICRQITHNDRVIWAYDDFQNILNVKIQDEKETFGKDKEGKYYVDFSRKDDELQDIVLHKCYRNPRKVLLSAFALGLGIYNKNKANEKAKIVQRLENNEHWTDLGFEVEAGNSAVGDGMVISRPLENSPLMKNEFLDDDETVIVRTFEHIHAECEEVVKLILQDLEKELNPEDISVIGLDNRYVRLYFSLISEYLESHGVNTFNLLSAPTDNTTYKLPNHVTLSTIYKAKGNEAGSVYVIGIDAIFRDKDNITERNKLFTAITRSRAWVTLSGIAPIADTCVDEVIEMKKNDFKLVFTQPSEADVRMIKQDLGKKQRKLNELEKIKGELERLGMSEEELKSQLFQPPKK